MSIYTKEESKTWNLAARMFRAQRAAILANYPNGTPPLLWREIGLELRLLWWEKARKEEQVIRTPDFSPPTRAGRV